METVMPRLQGNEMRNFDIKRVDSRRNYNYNFNL